MAQLFLAARGVAEGRAAIIKRREVIDRAAALDSCPDWLDEYHLRQIEQGSRSTGTAIRYLAAAAGVDLVSCLQALRLWPPLGKPADTLLSVAHSVGAEVLRHEGERLFLRVPGR